MKRVGGAFLAGLAMLCAPDAGAGVTGVVTHSSATVRFRPDVSGDPNNQTFDGEQLASSLGDNAFGSGGTFA